MYKAKKTAHKGTSYTLRNVDEMPEAKAPSRQSSIQRNIEDISEAGDGGWGWVVTFSTFMHRFLMDGFSYSFGTFVADFLLYFGGSNGKILFLNSTIIGVYHCMGFVSGSLMDKYSCRRLTIIGMIVASVGLFLSTFSPNLDVMILLYGVVGGFGFGLVYTPSVAIVGHYFNKHRALATGIAVCGSGIGGFVFAPLSVFLKETYGWKGAMWILSAIVLNGVVFAAFYRPLPQHKTSVFVSSNKTSCWKDNSQYKHLVLAFKQTFNLSLLTSPTFALYNLSNFLIGIGFFIPFNFLPVFATSIDLSASQGALLLSVMGIFNTVSRVLTGFLSDQSWADSIIINGTILLIGGIVTCFVSMYNTYAVLMIYSAIFGISAGTFVALMPIILVELKGEKMLSNTFGLCNTVLGISIFIGSPIAGAFSDLTGSYDAAFYFAGGAIGLAGLLCFPLRHIARWEHHRYHHGDETTEPRLTSMQIHHM